MKLKPILKILSFGFTFQISVSIKSLEGNYQGRKWHWSHWGEKCFVKVSPILN